MDEEYKDICEHEYSIEMWKCNQCLCNISKFGLFFDDQNGTVQTYSKIVYEN